MRSNTELKKQRISSSEDDSLQSPEETLRDLNALATSKLARIIRGRTEARYDQAEIVATRSLLQRNN